MRIILFAITFSCIFSVSMARAVDYVVGVQDMPYAPFSWTKGNEYFGVGRDILDSFASARGHQFSYVALPYLRNLKGFLAGDFDFQFPEDPAWSNEIKNKSGKRIYYSDALIDYIDGVSVLSKRGAIGLDELKRMGTIIGFSPVDAYRKRAAQGNLYIYENPVVDGLISQLLLGRTDGIYLSIDVVQNHMRRMNMPGAATFAKHLPYRKSNYKLATIEHPELMKEFNAFLTDSEDLINKIKASYELNY